MWDQLSDLRNKFRTKRRPEKLGTLSEKKLGECYILLNVLSSLICSADGAGVGGGEGGGGVDCLVFEAEQGSQVQSLFLRYCAAFKSPEHFACTHPVHLVHR